MEILKDTPDCLRLKGALHISGADELRKLLTDNLAGASALNLDLSPVDACDTASLQLLCAARHSAMQANKLFHVTALSDAITACCAALGVGGNCLGIDTLNSACPATSQDDCQKRGIDGAE